LFRVLQEALHNSAKHSGVRQFDVRLWGDNGLVHLTISDHGTGFEVTAVNAGPGIGLATMTERIKLVSGDLSIESAPARGTKVHARVPIAPTTSMPEPKE